jgi:hypothetical protein
VKYHPLPPISDILAVLDYDPETGLFAFKDGRKSGISFRRGYRVIRIDGRLYQAGRVAFKVVNGREPLDEVDHINGNNSDDRGVNLRDATREQNNRNQRRRRDNACGFKGVSMEKRTGRYRALITAGGKQQSLGYFPTAFEAHQAYMRAAMVLHKDFARLQ